MEGKMLKVEVTSTEMIKPSSPTSPDHRIFKLSLLDQLPPPTYVPIILFYTNNGNNSNDLIQLSEKLRRSLSKILVSLYPIAGRMRQDSTIDCNDEGAEFSHARVNTQLSEFLKHPRMEDLDKLFPSSFFGTKSGSAEVLLAIQLNAFECGGVAIGVGLSHKIVDAASLVTFLAKWGAIARGVDDAAGDVKLVSDSLFPPRSTASNYNYDYDENAVTKRLVFDGSAIAALKTRAATHPLRLSKPTRVEVVSALIWRCSMKAQQKESHAPVSVATHTVNLRKRMVPPLPDSSFGNNYARAVTKGCMVTEHDDKMHGYLEKQVRDAISEIDSNYIEELRGPNGALKAHQKMKTVIEKYSESGIHIFHFNSWCGFPFYDVDFGWGKPTWIGAKQIPVKNHAGLLDSSVGDGMEVWISMKPDEMAKFEQDQELLSFATII